MSMTPEQYNRLLTRAKKQTDEVARVGAKSATATWALADTLAEIEIAKPGRAATGVFRVTLQMLADDLGLGKAWVQRLRMAALDFPPQLRVPELSVTLHRQMLQKHEKPSKAYAALKAAYDEFGPKATMRELFPEQRDLAALAALKDKQTIERLANKLNPSQRSFVMAAMRSPSVSVGSGDAVNADNVQRVVTTIRRVVTTIEHVAADVRGTSDERVLREVGELADAVRALTDAVTVEAV